MADGTEGESQGDASGDVETGESFAERARRAAAEIRDDESQRSSVIDAADKAADAVIGNDPG